MNRDDKTLRTRPANPRAVRFIKGPDFWAIELLPSATVVEVATVLGGLDRFHGCKCFVAPAGGAYSVHPVDPHAPAPSSELVAQILQHGLTVDQLPCMTHDKKAPRETRVEKAHAYEITFERVGAAL